MSHSSLGTFSRKCRYQHILTGLVLFLALSSVSVPATALQATSIKRLDGVKALKVEILLGSGLAPKSAGKPGPSLLEGLEGDFSRAEEFESSLRLAIRGTLQSCGVSVSADAEDVLMVAIFGRAVLPSDPRNFQISMVEVAVYRASQAQCDCAPQEAQEITTFLGFTEDEDLESSLISQVLEVLTERAGCQPEAEHLEPPPANPAATDSDQEASETP